MLRAFVIFRGNPNPILTKCGTRRGGGPPGDERAYGFGMINYTERLTLLMQDIVRRVHTLSFINISEVLVFARFGRSDAEGAFATCHCLNLPASEPGYYFWRDRRTGRMTRRSEWFITKSPTVSIGSAAVNYLISFALPRFCDQTLRRSRKEELYPGYEPWVAKLDTVMHELYHVDPHEPGIRRVERADGTFSRHSHGPAFFENVSRLVREYLASNPDPATFDFLRHDFAGLTTHFDGVVGATFKTFPSFPQRYLDVMATQPRRSQDGNVRIVPIKRPQLPIRYTEDDLSIRLFLDKTSKQLVRKGKHRAA